MTIPELEKKIATLEECLKKAVQANTSLFEDLAELRLQLGVQRRPQVTVPDAKNL